MEKTKALRVLNLEDSLLEAELVHATLKNGGIECEIFRVQTRADFAAALESDEFDLILAEYSLPAFDGLSALKVAQEIRPEAPFVLVSGMVGEEMAIEALKNGATDYVLKNGLERLVPAVQRALREAEERAKRKRAEEALQYQLGLTRTITDNAADSLFLWDTEGRVTFINPAAEETFGWRQEELLGEVLHDRMHHHPDGRPYPMSECPLIKVFESGQTLRDHEDVFFRRDGSVVDVACSHAPIVVDGRITGAVLAVRDITERKRAREAPRESEEYFKTTFEQAAVGVAHVALDGSWIRVNQKLCDILGYPSEELLRLTFQDITHPDDLDRDVGHLRRMLKGETDTYSTEKRYFRKDGSVVWINLTVSLARERSGEPKYFISVIQDINQRKRVEAALKRSEECYRTFVEHSTEGIWRVELERSLPADTPDDEQIEHIYRHAYLAECNDSLAHMYGFSRADELLGKRISQLLPRSIPENVQYLRTFVHYGYQATDVESRGIDRWGNLRYFLNNFTGFVENGSLVRVWGTRRDITESRRIEEALRHSEELYRMVVEQAAESIFLVDAKTKYILEANDAFHRSLGYTAEEMQRLTLYDFVSHDRESVDRYTQRVLEEGRFVVGERKYRRKDGTLLDVEVSASAISHNGRVAMCVTAHDVTERKRAENMLRRSLDALLGLYEAGQVLGSTLESEELGSRLLNIMQRVSSLSTAVISRPDEHGRLCVWRAVGLENLPEKIRYIPSVESTLQEVLESGEHRLLRVESRENGANPLVCLILPLRVQNRSIGLLEVYGPEDLLEEDTMDILDSMTSQAASALENARLYGELTEREKRLESLVGKLLAAQEEERRRVAYEVHDGLAQVAVSAHQHLQAFSRRHPPDTERGKRDLQRTSKLVRQTVSDARKVIANLRPTALDDLGLAAALSLEVEGLRADGYRVGYKAEFGDERLPDTVEIGLFRAAQEALTNVRKHAQTGGVSIELRRREDEVRLEVRDCGRGFDPAELAGGGPGERVGLAGMRERVALLGGELEIRSKPSEGTSVTVTLPVNVKES